MDSWPTSREVERIVPFAERAQKCIEELHAYRQALSLVLGAEATPMLRTMLTASSLLTEAKHRGVKGKDLGR